jgi:hypothetical protein
VAPRRRLNDTDQPSALARPVFLPPVMATGEPAGQPPRESATQYAAQGRLAPRSAVSSTLVTLGPSPDRLLPTSAGPYQSWSRAAVARAVLCQPPWDRSNLGRGDAALTGQAGEARVFSAARHALGTGLVSVRGGLLGFSSVPSPRSSGDRASPSGGESAGSNPAGGTV